MYYSFVLCKAKTMNCQEPKFDLFRQKEGVSPFDWLNQKKYEPTGEYFIYHNYTPIAGRMFFTESNAIKIDGIRIDIEDLYQKNLLKENEYLPKNKKCIDYILTSVIHSDNYLNIIENINNLRKQKLDNDIFIKKYINTILNSELITKNIKNKIRLYLNL